MCEEQRDGLGDELIEDIAETIERLGLDGLFGRLRTRPALAAALALRLVLRRHPRDLPASSQGDDPRSHRPKVARAMSSKRSRALRAFRSARSRSAPAPRCRPRPKSASETIVRE